MAKDIVLLFIGGTVTFIVTLVVKRITRRSPRIMWRMLPPVHLPSQELTAFNIVVSNQGNDAATNVHSVVKLSEGAEIDSVEIQPSESALKYSVTAFKDVKSRLEVDFPTLQSNVDCVLSFLTRQKDPKDVQVSIAADGNVVGHKHLGVSLDEGTRFRKRIIGMEIGFFVVINIFVLIFALWLFQIRSATRDAMLQQAVGDIYYETGDYKKAIGTYSQGYGKWYLPTISSVDYRMARAFAQQTNHVSAVRCLTRILERGNNDLAAFAIIDPAFDKIRANNEFNAFCKRAGKEPNVP